MKTSVSVLIILFLSILFYGCPYESTVPIDSPSVKINNDILGAWEDTHNHGEIYKVSRLDDFHYHVLKSKTDSENMEEYIAFTSELNGISFINLLEKNSSETNPSYAFFKIQLETKDKIRLSEVTENIDEKFKSSEELKAFIKFNMKNSYFFGNNEIEFVRLNK